MIFGLFHGVVLLPVILSWVGPKPYNSHKNGGRHRDDTVESSDMIEAHEVTAVNAIT